MIAGASADAPPRRSPAGPTGGRATRRLAGFRVRVSSLGGHRDWQWQARTSSRELRVRVSASGGPQRPVPMSESPPPRRLRSPPCADRRRSSIKSRASPDRAYTRLRATVCESHSNTASPTCDRHTHDSKQAERIARDYCAAHAQAAGVERLESRHGPVHRDQPRTLRSRPAMSRTPTKAACTPYPSHDIKG